MGAPIPHLVPYQMRTATRLCLHRVATCFPYFRSSSGTWKARLHALAYLMATADLRLTYLKHDRKLWDDYKRFPQAVGLIEGYGDASFAPDAMRSMQCLQVFMEGNLVAWSASKQTFMGQSWCEAEMITLMDLANFTLAMSYLADELFQGGSKKMLAGDNIAALAIYGGTAAHWRTRHLRIPARAFQTARDECFQLIT